MTPHLLNCAIRFRERVMEHPERTAFFSTDRGGMTFRELDRLVGQAQSLLNECGVDSNTPVVLAALPSPETFAFLLATLARGAPILLIEPWLPLREVAEIIDTLNPRVFFAGNLGKIWGLRTPSIRKIPYWKSEKDLRSRGHTAWTITNVRPDHPAMIAFSSGTSGRPKGSIRTQEYLWKMHFLILEAHPRWNTENSPDWVTFPNVALFNLGLGRTSVFAPRNPTPKKLRHLQHSLPVELQPRSMTCGPAFLKTLLETPGFESIRDFSIGGALTDLWIFEAAFQRWKDSHFVHVYGGSEAEPVTLGDARELVKLSRDQGYFQTLALGQPFHHTSGQLDSQDVLWVSGPHVSGEYWGNPIANEGIKRRDERGTLWHCMGDRVRIEPNTWWYAGRQFQTPQDFQLEQVIYSEIQSSAAFLHREVNGVLHACGEAALLKNAKKLKQKFPEISQIHPTRIIRDRRHRARIDRKKSLPRGLRTSTSSLPILTQRKTSS